MTASAKVAGHGQAAILSDSTLKLLFSEGLTSPRDRALFGVCLFTAVRIGEACSLLRDDIFDSSYGVRNVLTVRRESSKGKLASRAIPIHPELKSLLEAYRPYLDEESQFLFPGRHPKHRWKHLQTQSAHRILRVTSHKLGIEGISTHSFRRTALTCMSNSGIPLRVIQEISGHTSLDVLRRYLEVTDEQVIEAVLSLPVLGVREAKKSILVNLGAETSAIPSLAPATPHSYPPY